MHKIEGYLSLVSGPATEPLTVDEARDFLRQDIADDDLLIEGLIAAAREHVETETNQALISQQWDYFLPGFTDTQIVLPRTPLITVDEITYVDTLGATQTLATSVYGSESALGSFYLKYNESWPSVRSDVNAVKVRFTAGHGTSADDVPENLKLAVKMLVNHWYEHRDVATELPLRTVPLGVSRLLANNRIRRF